MLSRRAPRLTDDENHALVIVERVASILSILGCLFIVSTFALSSKFRKPVNRLIFYASWGNAVITIAGLMAVTPIFRPFGKDSALCQFQGFLVQITLPADAMWNLSMAINVYLTVFKKWDAARLRRIEPIYHATNYGLTSLIAFIYCFINEPDDRGKIYGPATLWCWISTEWGFLRVALCYGPIWVCMAVTFGIYVLSGLNIFRKHRELLASSGSAPSIAMDSPFTAIKTTEVHVTSEEHTFGLKATPTSDLFPGCGNQESVFNPFKLNLGTRRDYDPYTVTVGRGDGLPQPSSEHPAQATPPSRHDAALEAHAAAWSYTKVAVLYFLSLNITWVPSSINRVYSLINDNDVSVGLSFAAGVVLPLMGFWNTLIYVVTSWDAVRTLSWKDLRPKGWQHLTSQDAKTRASGKSVRGSQSPGGSMKGMRRIDESQEGAAERSKRNLTESVQGLPR